MSRKGVNIHEYQGKALFREEGVAVQEGVHCTTVDQALEAYDSLGSKIVAVKSQIHAGGRGKGNLYCPDTGDLQMEGGVKIALSRDEVETMLSDAGCAVSSMRYHTDADSGQFRGFVHAELADESSLSNALALAGTRWRGRELRVSHSETGKKRS